MKAEVLADFPLSIRQLVVGKKDLMVSDVLGDWSGAVKNCLKAGSVCEFLRFRHVVHGVAAFNKFHHLVPGANPRQLILGLDFLTFRV